MSTKNGAVTKTRTKGARSTASAEENPRDEEKEEEEVGDDEEESVHSHNRTDMKKEVLSHKRKTQKRNPKKTLSETPLSTTSSKYEGKSEKRALKKTGTEHTAKHDQGVERDAVEYDVNKKKREKGKGVESENSERSSKRAVVQTRSDKLRKENERRGGGGGGGGTKATKEAKDDDARNKDEEDDGVEETDTKTVNGAEEEEEDVDMFSDVKTVAMYAFAGAVMGACYRMATSYREKTYAANNLEPAPVAFDVDPMATHLFGEFNAFRKFDEVHYLGAFHATDWILNLERVLRDKRPRSKDEGRCQRYHRVAKTCAHRLCVRYVAKTKRITPQREREIAELLYEFEQFINKHMMNVTIYCKSIHKIPQL
jgi:hypothetical protein